MHRIDSEHKALNLFGTGKHGFTEGDPSTGDAATEVSDDWLNEVQEEIANVVETSGATLTKGAYTQLLTAILQFSDLGLALKNWSDVTPAGGISDMRGITNVDHRIKVCGENPDHFYLSQDAGQTWAIQAASAAYAGNLRAIHYAENSPSGDKIVAVGSAGGIESMGSIGTSPSTARTPAGAYAGEFRDIYHDGSGLWCAVGSGEEIQTSPDAVTWTNRASPFGVGPPTINTVHHDGAGLWMAGASNGEIATSPDGITWSLVTSNGSAVYEIIYDSTTSHWLIVSSLGVRYSTDEGSTWLTPSTEPNNSGEFAQLPDTNLLVSYGNGGGGGLSYSGDGGITWQDVDAVTPFSTFNLHALAYCFGRLFAIGDDGANGVIRASLRGLF